MPDVTLEALAARVEALERRVDELAKPPSPPGFRPGTGDWDAADKAAAELRDSSHDHAAGGPPSGHRPPTQDLAALTAALDRLCDAVDFDALDAQNALDLKRAGDHRP